MKEFSSSSIVTGKLLAITPAKFEQSRVVVKTDTSIVMDYIFDNLLQAVKVGKQVQLFYTKHVKDGVTYDNCVLVC